MNAFRIAQLALVITMALASTACSEESRQAAADAKQAVAEARQTLEAATGEGGTVALALDEARQKLHTENLTLGSAELGTKAEITPQGDLLINGIAVPLTDPQRDAVMVYRGKLLAVAESGMAMGEGGAKLAGQAVSQVVAGLFDGNVEQATARIEAEAQKMAVAGLALCEQAKGLQAAQTTLAALVPEFAPYAKAIDLQGDCATVASAVGGHATGEPAADAPAAPTAPPAN